MRSALRDVFFPRCWKKRCGVSFLLLYRDVDEARAKASANDQTLSTYAVEAVKSYLKDIQMDKQSHKAIDARRKESV